MQNNLPLPVSSLYTSKTYTYPPLRRHLGTLRAALSMFSASYVEAP